MAKANWLPERWETFTEALGHRRYVVANTASGVAGVAFAVLAALGVSAYFSQWLLAIAILGFLLFWFVLGYANGLRQRLKPRLVVMYDDAQPDFRKEIQLRTDSTGSPRPGRSIRLRVSCARDVNVDGCTGYLTKIEHRSVGDQFSSIPFYEPTKLHWSLEEPHHFDPITIHPRVPRYLGVCRTDEALDGFRLSMSHRSYVTPEAFTELGEYRLHIEIASKDGITIPVLLTIKWNGNWDDIHACLAENT